jgi:hypothetical protein
VVVEARPLKSQLLDLVVLVTQVEITRRQLKMVP